MNDQSIQGQEMSLVEFWFLLILLIVLSVLLGYKIGRGK